MIGRKLGHYEILASLGKGGMGEVWRARDTKLGREVAIKTLPTALANEPDRLARFEREAKLLAALNHPHIAAIYGLDEHEGISFLAMELVEGVSLARKVQGALRVEEALPIALQIAEALEAAHDKGVVHRDLKPANIMITRDGQVKVLDFGLAKALSADPNATMAGNSPALSLAMTQQGLIVGTAGYMSPEQAGGEPTDQRTDIWAFGVVLYEMLTGQPLFVGDSVPHILADVLRTPPDWSRLPKGLHPRLRLLLERSLEKNPRNRYHSIADARVDIEKVLADPAGAATQLASSVPRRGQSFWLGAAGMAIAIVAAGVTWLLTPERAVPPTPVVRFEFAVRQGQVLRNTDRDAIAISADGTKIVYNTNDGLYLRASGELEARLIPGTENAFFNPFVSPDGEWVAFYDGQLRKIRTNGGSSTVLATVGIPLGASWHPDGSRIVFGQSDGIMEVSANGGVPKMLIPSRDVPLWDPQYLPNGMILYTRWPGQREIVVQSPGADAHVLFAGERSIYTPTGFLIATDVATMPTALFARTFDVDTLDVGAPVLVAQNVALRNNKAQFAIGSGGALAYVYGEPVSGTPIDLRLTHVARDGSRRALAAPPRPYRNPRVSPDGTRVAVEIVGDDTKSSIWVFDLAGDADIRRLTQVTEGNNLRPIWTPDGEHITFMSDRDGPGSIYSQDADGRGPAEKLTTAEPGIFHLPESWAPDGTLSFAVVHGGFGAQSWGLYTRNPDGETALFYDLPTSNQWSSAFSPDGRWIAYASGEDSNLVYDFRIFVERYPRTGERYEVASGGAVTPVWSRDGTEIFYRRGFQESARTMNVVRVLESERRFRSTTANSIQIEGFLNFPNYRDFDPLPDGSGWIMLTAVDPPGQDDAPAASDRIVVVLNWFEELERRLPKAN